MDDANDTSFKCSSIYVLAHIQIIGAISVRVCARPGDLLYFRLEYWDNSRHVYVCQLWK